VRSKSSARESHPEPGLEPLPVYDGGVAVDPEPALPVAADADARALARECVDAVRAVLDERRDVRARPPWNNLGPIPEIQPRAATFYSTFNRMIALAPTRLAGLEEWWRRGARDGRVRISRRLSLEEPRPLRGGTWRAYGRLRSPLLVRSIPVELLLWPYIGSWTRMSLEPQRSVHAGRRYFKRGHRSLDVLTNRLLTELASSTPTPTHTSAHS
jgi:hypothetical protein